MSEDKKPLAKIFSSSEEASKWIKENPGIKIIGIKTSGSIEIYYESKSIDNQPPPTEYYDHVWGCDPCPRGKKYPWGDEDRPADGADYAYFH
ncbi:MAG TPA: hypothetical protein PLA41_00970 [Candidatus Pacearchaeota archaeon]|nr:hypothetical protein [Candidatus Pacearchaeota archaeon]HPM08236.1 hypothetical protein [Candidatus Pacearchaeota archaeon]HQI74444.1 hypothetical protein [Candidatus Pacearchaeota archaeon]